MFKSRHNYLSNYDTFNSQFLGFLFLSSLILGTNTLLAVESAESVMQNLAFDFCYEATYMYIIPIT